MHVVLMVDDERLRNERDWFNRTVVGLAAAGAQITRVMPEEEPGDSRVALTTALHIKPSRLPWTRRKRRGELAKEMGAAEPDLIHAMGSGCWGAAMEIARALSIPVAIDVWSVRDLKGAIRLASSPEVSGIFAVSEGLARELKKHIDPSIVCVLPIGVYIKDQVREILASPQDAVAAVMVGRGSSLPDVQAVLEGYATLARSCPQCMLFADLRAEVAHATWELAGRLKIRDRFSIIPSLNRNRKLAIRADVVIVPGATGTSSSFMLEAMASPMVPIIVRDEMVSQPPAGGGACVLQHPSAVDWTRTLETVLLNPDDSRSIATQARAWVGRHHRMSVQVNRLYDAYETIVTGGSVRLPSSS